MENDKSGGLGPDNGALIEAETGDLCALGPAPEMDPADYLGDMDGFDMTEAQKIALLETLWSIMRSFVEMGVDVASADPCGQIFEGFAPDSVEGVTSSFSNAASAPSGRNNKNKEDAPI